MPRDLLRRSRASAVLVALAGMFLVMAGNTGPAFAADDDDEGTWDQQALRSILRGIGLRNGREGSIEYKERPPLVVPPTRALPPPDTTGSISQPNPAWPSDPDEAKKKAAKKAASERKWSDVSTWGDALRPNELKAGRVDKLPNEPGIKPGQTVETSTQLRPDELGYKGDGLWSTLTGLGHTFDKEKPAEGAKFLREPPRASLTQPPSGYRTPSPEQPYGLNYKDAERAKKGPVDMQTVGAER
ncbi:MAG: hypothetical protein JO228_08045 [Xanthobacteraceae bacterium]|nr:hypothetical protein [Xanthobacteraceae bacterium]